MKPTIQGALVKGARIRRGKTMQTPTYYIARCGIFDSNTEHPYVDRLDGEDDPLAQGADTIFWTLYKRESNGLSVAVADYATRAEARAALLDILDDGPKLTDPLGDPPISISAFFASYARSRAAAD